MTMPPEQHAPLPVMGGPPHAPQPHPATFTLSTSGPGGTVTQHKDLGEAFRAAEQYLRQLANPGPGKAPIMGSATVSIAHQGAIPF